MCVAILDASAAPVNAGQCVLATGARGNQLILNARNTFERLFFAYCNIINMIYANSNPHFYVL